jgi:hypothetical protein
MPRPARRPAQAARAATGLSPEAQLAAFLARYSPQVATTARSALRKLRRLVPGAVEIVYDNYNALAIGFGPSERASEAILSIALYPRWVSLFFLSGARLRDPGKRLRGSGSRVRHVVLESPAVLDDPAIRKLIAAALEAAPAAPDPRRRRRLVIKSVSVKQRPRRPA